VSFAACGEASDMKLVRTRRSDTTTAPQELFHPAQPDITREAYFTASAGSYFTDKKEPLPKQQLFFILVVGAAICRQHKNHRGAAAISMRSSASLCALRKSFLLKFI